MPHMNVLDLEVFPAISRRHSHLARSLHGTRVLQEDEILETAVKVWETLPSSKVGNAFVTEKKVAEKVIQSNGGNDFLGNVEGSLSSGVRKEFVDTEEGVTRIDGAFILFSLAEGISLKAIAPEINVESPTKCEISMKKGFLHGVAM